MGPPGGDESPASEPSAGSLSLEDAYREHAHELRRIVERKFQIPRCDAEAIVNDAFMAYLLKKDEVRRPRDWLVGTVCHASRGYWREAMKTEPMPPDAAQYVDPATAGIERRMVYDLTLKRALTKVSPRCREMLRLYYAEGYSAREIAALLGLTTNNVNQLLHRCRRQLQNASAALKDTKS